MGPVSFQEVWNERLAEEKTRNERFVSMNFPAANEIIGSSEQAEVTKLAGTKENCESPRNAHRDRHGNLTEYTIGPEGHEGIVKVEYSNPENDSPTVSTLDITRSGGGSTIHYQRERSDPNDPESPYTYSETRDGKKGDIQFGGLTVGKDGRVSLYFDVECENLALSFNPETAEEEYDN